MRRLRFFRNVIAEEDGQEIVEFALIVTLLIVLLMVPVDVFRYANTRMILNDAATDAVSSVDYGSIEDNTYKNKILDSVQNSYGSRLNEVKIDSFNVEGETPDPYTYHVFNSDLQDKLNYADRFDGRNSNYHYQKVSLTLSCTENAITPFGGMFFGGDMKWTIKSDPKTCNVYTKGYVEGH